MKKLTALLLALIMVLSLFAACGEKTEVPADAQAGAPDAEVNVPENESDGEEAEKDVTEIAPPDAPVIITTGPAAQGQSTDTQQTPQTQTPQTQTPQTQTQTQEPQTQTQTPQTQTQTPQTSQPAQPAALGPGVEKSEYMAYFYGDSFMNANALADTVIAFARYDGIKLTVRNGTADTRGSTGLYNLYSRFNFSGTTFQSPKDDTFNSLLTKPNHMDFFVLFAGRDRTISLPEYAEQGFQGFKYIQNEYFKANPNGRIVLVGPSGYEEGNDGALAERVLLTGKSLKEHNALIKQEVERYYSVAPADKTVLSPMYDAFDFFRTNYGSSGIELYDHSHIYPSVAGSYYMACILYAQMFGKSAYGIKDYGFLDEETALLMQKAAHRYVFGKEPTSANHAPDKYVPSFEEINPRTTSKRDPRYANEKYPQYYDELFATMYALFGRERWIQYNQTNMDRVKSTSIRRTNNTIPEAPNPQNTVYLDCSGFTFCSYFNAFGYNFDNDSMRTAYLIDYDKGRVFYWDGTNPEFPAEEAKEKLRDTLQPGDVICYHIEVGEKWGHVMIYIGNGRIMHCSGSSRSGGGSADYDFPAMLDSREYLGSLINEPADYLFDKDGKQYLFTDTKRFAVFRPLSLGLKPTEQATLRLKNLEGIIAYKETSAPRGITVNPGEDVTFTYVLRNDTKASKTVEIADALPEGVTYKSGDAKYQNGKLKTSVTVPSHQTVRLSFTVTVNSNVKNGTTIANQNGTVGGVILDNVPIYVAKTLSAGDRAKIDAAARKVSASTDYEMISKVYKEALGKDLPFKSAEDLAAKTFSFVTEGKKEYFVLAENREPDLIACLMAGGASFGSNINKNRPKYFERQHIMTGDVILFMKDAKTPELWLGLDGGALAVVQNGAVKIIPVGLAINYIETLFGQYSYALIRPSQGM